MLNNVKQAHKASPLSKLQLIPLDSKYWSVDIDTWETILKYTGVDKKKYISERYDCDDFAFTFKGNVAQKLDINGVGFVCDYSGRHAYNCILVNVGNELKFYVIEPQNDKFVVKGDIRSSSESYRMEKGFIIL